MHRHARAYEKCPGLPTHPSHSLSTGSPFSESEGRRHTVRQDQAFSPQILLGPSQVLQQPHQRPSLKNRYSLNPIPLTTIHLSPIVSKKLQGNLLIIQGAHVFDGLGMNSLQRFDVDLVNLGHDLVTEHHVLLVRLETPSITSTSQCLDLIQLTLRCHNAPTPK